MNEAACRIEVITWRGWAAARLSNSLVSAVAVPAIGGRLMAFDLGPLPFLFVNPRLAGLLFTPEAHQGDGSLAAWKNYGGDKTWPAPQGWDGPDQWPGPPDPVLDSGKYHADWGEEPDGSVWLTMTSSPDARTGLRIRRLVRLRPGRSTLELELTFENVSARPVRWAIWDVTQLDCSRQRPDGDQEANPACWLYIPTADAPAAGRPYRVMFGADHPQWRAGGRPGLLGVHYQGQIGKIGVTNPAGWLAFANGATGATFCARFAYEPGADYPDGGASTECWTEAPDVVAPLPYESVGYLLEAEVLGPLRRLAPGETTTLAIEWGAAHCPGPIVGVGPAGCVHRPLAVAVAYGQARLTGRFGSFVAGQAEVIWLDAGGRALGRAALGPVGPLAPFRLDARLALPAGARSAWLVLRADLTGELLTLAEAAVV